ncbi:MAG: PQQ-binding-like beta-propeller repeat protein [Planctomycetota bacterium]
MLTCYFPGESNAKRQLLCFGKASGARVWSVDFPIDYGEDRRQGFLTEHGYASNTPASDGKNVYLFLGKGGVHSVDLHGNRNWSVDVGKESSNRQWGSAASLPLDCKRVFVNASEESQAIIALDKATGAEFWRQEAGMLELTYGTPRVVNRGGADPVLVISVPGEIWALDATIRKLQ